MQSSVNVLSAFSNFFRKAGKVEIAFLLELSIKREDYDKKFIMRNVVALYVRDLARKFKPNAVEFLGNFCYHVNALRHFCSIMGREPGEVQLWVVLCKSCSG